ncbi:hypothetical protein [Zwartia vadi]|uniref:hypothetical protein n=1 Tax=Zwartia vadi TaxID=3058168 RepID=UPI0025B292BD|nr:hypothetical protein [Zwartia vadi]MDN3988380.1 hypothetical protein [Zwartia vadi]
MSGAQQNVETTRTTPWWREPWPWILMAGPALAIVGCAITIALALQSFSDQPILEGGMKRGLVVEKNPGKPPSTEKH